jgi:hypothetical protein
MLKTKQKLREIRARMRFNRWRSQPHKQSINLNYLCVVCYQERKSELGLIPSIFDSWCDECFIDLPLWLKHKKTTAEELAQLAKQKKDEAEKRRLKREEIAKIQDARNKKKVKLTGFENVETENNKETIKDVDRPVDSGNDTNSSIEEQRQKLESIFLYEDDDK